MKIFTLPYEPYGAGDTERCVEVPWSLSCVPENTERLLDVGYAYAEGRYLKELMLLPVPEIYGVDAAACWERNLGMTEKMIKAQADLREHLPYNDEWFDVILCISTIEHVGHNNGRYFRDIKNHKHNDDITVLRNLARILVPNGKLVITVPYGRRSEGMFFKQYSKPSLDKLLTSVPSLKVLRKDLFICRKDGWYNANEKDVAETRYGSINACAASSLACVLLTKGN